MIEVFKTNVTDYENARFLKVKLNDRLRCEASFDLEDCDRILRVQFFPNDINPELVISVLREFGFTAQILPENYPLPVLKSLINNVPLSNCW